MGYEGNTEIAQQDIVAFPHQHILRFHITVNELFLVRMLQSAGKLPDIRDNGSQGNPRTIRMPLAQCAIGRVVHHQEGDVMLHTKVCDPYDMGMDQASNRLCLLEEAIHILLVGHGRGQHFKSNLHLKIVVLTEVNISESAASNEADDSIVTELLT